MPPSTSNRHSVLNEESSDAEDLRIEMENVGMKTEQAHIPQVSGIYLTLNPTPFLIALCVD